MTIGLYGLEVRRRLVLQQGFQHPKTGKVYAEESAKYQSAVTEYTETVRRIQQYQKEHRRQKQLRKERQAQLRAYGVPQRRGLYELCSCKQFVLGWMFHNLKTGEVHPPDSPKYHQAMLALREVERQMDERRRPQGGEGRAVVLSRPEASGDKAAEVG